jgi:GH15 family glucan-1,4-alpha-glucosidase
VVASAWSILCRSALGSEPSFDSLLVKPVTSTLRSIDARLLRLPQVGFLPITDVRIARTIDVAQSILCEDGLVRRRQRHNDGSDEGAFLICTCWLANCRAMQGRMREARVHFGRLLDLRNDVGLLAEEWDVGSKRLMGNFPQALSHLALVNTAVRLSQDCDDSQTPT